MFKKIEIWILYLVVLLGIPLTIGFGFLVRQELEGKIKFGRISQTALFLSEIPVKVKKLVKIKDQPFIEVENRFPSLKAGFNGTPNSNESYLLLARYDGDLKEGIVELVDLTNFTVLHTWNPDINAFNKSVENLSEYKFLNRDRNNARYLMLHPILLKDGGLVFKHDTPLIKIDACSNLIFQNKHDHFHHSIEVDFEGNIWVPSYHYPQSLPVQTVGRGIKDEGYSDDAIVKLSPNGEILFEKSVSQIFIDNGLEYLLFAVGNGFTKDPIHLNDIQPVNFDGDFWKKGDVFISIRNQSMVFLYRPSTNKIIWKGTGKFFNQHDVDILDGHRISIFNNNSKTFVNGLTMNGKHNEVIIYDFKSNQYSTYLNESLIKNDVRSKTQGRSEILVNGELFVEETNYGRTLFFDADGSLKWFHLNKADNGKTYFVSWSRILYDKEEIKIVNNFLESRGKCND